MSFLTIFTAPKPFTNPHIDLIQRNAIRSWLALGQDVEVLVIGAEDGLAEAAQDLGFRFLLDVERNASGTPLIPSLFDLARRHTNSPLLAYVNADIILMPDFVLAARQVAEQQRDFLMVGQRWDLDVTTLLDTSNGWTERLITDVRSRGSLHGRNGSDYFIFPRHCFTAVPAFAVGRAGWDNWMLFEARNRGWKLVDATKSVTIVHQNHDYSHLPGGKPHYRQPETFENIRFAGGRMITRFTLADVDSRYTGGRVESYPLSWTKFWREIETFPLIRLHSKRLASLFYAVFHPQRAYTERRQSRAKRQEGKE